MQRTAEAAADLRRWASIERRMEMKQMIATVGLFAFATAILVGAEPKVKRIDPTAEFTGSVKNESLIKDAPTLVTTTDALSKLWQTWKIADPKPKVDFKKQLVVLRTARGSILGIMLTLDDKGDLRVTGDSSRDLEPGFRYVIAIVGRSGIKTVNGKQLSPTVSHAQPFASSIFTPAREA
jgi:hypothetical protein